MDDLLMITIVPVLGDLVKFVSASDLGQHPGELRTAPEKAASGGKPGLR